MKRFVLWLVFLTPFTAHADDYDPTALHDRGNQKLIGNLEVTGQIQSGQIRTAGQLRVDGVVSAKSVASDGTISATNRVVTQGSLSASTASISGDASFGGGIKAGSIAATGHISALSLSVSLPSCCESGFVCVSGPDATLAQKLELIKIITKATGLSLQEARPFVESGSDGDFGCGITFRAPIGDFSCRETIVQEEGKENHYISCAFCSSADQVGRISYTDGALLLCVADATATNGVRKLTFTPVAE